MISKLITIVVKVVDATQKGVATAAKSLKKLDTTSKATGRSFKDFNRIMFSATAFVSMFSRAVSGAFGAMERGAELSRISDQYSRIFGAPQGELYRNISKFTTTVIPRMDALNAAVSLGALGIVKSSEEVAQLIGRAGTAAKLAGKSAGEGVQHFTKFLETGEVSHLEFLKVLYRTNAAFQTEMSLLKGTTGLLGGMISTQRKLAIGRRLLFLATEGHLNSERDLADAMSLTKDSFSILSKHIGMFLGDALKPSTISIGMFNYRFADLIELVRVSRSPILDFVKGLTLAIGTLGSILFVIGTARLAYIAFAALMSPTTMFLVAGALAVLTVGFASIENPIGKATAAIEKFFNLIESRQKEAARRKAVSELVESYFGNRSNIMAGVMKLSGATAEQLKKLEIDTGGIVLEAQRKIFSETERRTKRHRVFGATHPSSSIIDKQHGFDMNTLLQERLLGTPRSRIHTAEQIPSPLSGVAVKERWFGGREELGDIEASRRKRIDEKKWGPEFLGPPTEEEIPKELVELFKLANQNSEKTNTVISKASKSNDAVTTAITNLTDAISSLKNFLDR